MQLIYISQFFLTAKAVALAEIRKLRAPFLPIAFPLAT